MVLDYPGIEISLMHHNDLFDYLVIHTIPGLYHQVKNLLMLEDKTQVDH